MRGRLLLGIDVGNTKLAFGLVSDEKDANNFVAHRVMQTHPERGVQQVLDRIIHTIKELAAECADGVSSLGIAFGGLVDADRQIALLSPNFPGWERVPLVSVVKEALPGVPVAMDNDANVAGLGEFVYGKGQQCRHFAYLTVSTGVGGAVLLDGQLVRGAQGAAAEFGHMIVQPGGPRCTCGGYGCLEALVSGTSIARQARDQVVAGSSLWQLAHGEPATITAAMVAQAARAGDEVAKIVFQSAGFFLGVGLANLISAFDPDKVILGGGVMNSAELILPQAVAIVQEHISGRSGRMPIIEASAMQNDVALWGAVALARVASTC